MIILCLTMRSNGLLIYTCIVCQVGSKLLLLYAVLAYIPPQIRTYIEAVAINMRPSPKSPAGSEVFDAYICMICLCSTVFFIDLSTE
ncbi:hypothetical protein GQ43DRAFT_281313 [Delitschia confertaspora ATCC 74209]|uniref:Uncharacterized protein n=1 Tax=Delitschia confertaspora ATCC 74209 TaxID=1513339 RepID=A0A9P4MMF6_9PLEO|nr:hypothetical protein GQ43DRAFT_281313 [Delitschia confertaspora ATCC 74209]